MSPTPDQAPAAVGPACTSAAEERRGASSAVLAKSGDLLFAGILLVVIYAVVFWLLSRGSHSSMWDLSRQPGGWVGVLLFVACSAVVHELLHVLGWRVLAGVRWNAISFEPTWRGLGVTALVRDPIPLSAFRVAALLPAIVLGVVPLTVGLVIGSALTALWGAFFLFECITDIALLRALRRLPGRAMVASHPTQLGCLTLATEA